MANYVDKQQFIGDLTDAFKSVLTVSDMEKVQSALLGVLSGYEITRISEGDKVAASADYLQMYIDAKTIEGRTPKTIARYQYIMNQFFNKENVTAQETTVFHIRDYFMREKNRGISDSTIAGYRDVFNSFFGKGTKRLHAGGVRKMLKNIGAKSGVENVHPHRFRRTFATNVINHGMAIQDVAAILGHEKLDTTMRYIYQSKERTKNAYEQHTA